LENTGSRAETAAVLGAPAAYIDKKSDLLWLAAAE
jgi:hypothetical protein